MTIFSSCQKELYFDLSAPSIGSLKADSTTGECLPMVINPDAVFQVDSAMTANNYVTLEVDVTSVGTYEIMSDTVNGVSFYASGTFGNTGINTVQLQAFGTPTAAGISSFIITYNDNSFCILDITVDPNNTIPTAVYTLGTSGVNCTGATPTGVYMASLPLTASNTMSVDVNVTTAGAYTLTTPVVNGVSFSASGLLSLTNTGVTLTGSGTPTAEGTFNYTISGAGTTCTFSVVFQALAPPAVYTLDCTGALLNGNYGSGIPMNISNTASIAVNVTSLGSYAISTPVVNGVSFVAAGIFSTLGAQQVILQANGTPTASGSFDYTITGTGTTCVFNVTYTGAPTNFITCKIDGVFTTFNVNATAGLNNSAGVSILSIDGSETASTIDPSISLGIIKSMGGSVTAATYNVNQIATGITVTCDYNTAAGVNFFAGTNATNQNQNPAFTITITSITATRCIGTFEGPVVENSGAGPTTKNITEGIFNVPIQ
jgi:hypothetical protein